MAEPASTTVAGLAAAGVGGAMLSAVGIEPAALFWAFVGATVGITFAAATGPLRTWIVFFCVALFCSIGGVGVALYFGGGATTRNIAACLLAIAFHPILSAVITRIPPLIDGLMRKFGIGGSQ